VSGKQYEARPGIAGGLAAVTAERTLAAIAYNLTRMARTTSQN
jgi:hypothetical protein